MQISYKNVHLERGLFDEEFNSLKLKELGNPLERLLQVIDFEMFRPTLEKCCLNHEKESNAGAKPYDPVLLYKILIIQEKYGLSDDQVEYQIRDRQSFKEFLGLTISDKVPDSKTIWEFREKLVKNNVSRKLFEEFNNLLKEKGLILKEGRIADATFLEVPRQHNTREENEAIKQGEELWTDKPNKKCQKDIDARWVKKREEKHFGYKNHIVICKVSKIISSFTVTPASVHDSKAIDLLLNENDSGQTFWADSAYTGKPIEDILKGLNMHNEICEKGFRNKPLTEKQKLSNNIKSKTRARVEHPFSIIKNVINGSFRRLIGIKRITEVISIINLIHNMTRYEQIVRLNLLPIKG